MTNIRRKHILFYHDISHGKNIKCKLCKEPNKYCNEDNCYTTASFNFKIDDRPIKCKKHKENNMVNVKRKYIVNNNNNNNNNFNTKIIYKKGYIFENNKKSKNNEIVKNNEENNINEENDINEEYLYDPDPKFTEDELKLIYADLDDGYFKVKDVIGIRKSEWDKLKLFPYHEWVRDYYGSKYAKKQIYDKGFFSIEDGLKSKKYVDEMVIKWRKIKDIENTVKKLKKI